MKVKNMDTLLLAKTAKLDYDAGHVHNDNSAAFDLLVQECEYLQSAGMFEQLKAWFIVVNSVFAEFNY